MLFDVAYIVAAIVGSVWFVWKHKGGSLCCVGIHPVRREIVDESIVFVCEKAGCDHRVVV